MYPFSSDPEELFEAIEQRQVEYLIVDRMTGVSEGHPLPALRRSPDAFCVELGFALSSAALLLIDLSAWKRALGAPVRDVRTEVTACLSQPAPALDGRLDARHP